MRAHPYFMSENSTRDNMVRAWRTRAKGIECIEMYSLMPSISFTQSVDDQHTETEKSSPEEENHRQRITRKRKVESEDKQAVSPQKMGKRPTTRKRNFFSQIISGVSHQPRWEIVLKLNEKMSTHEELLSEYSCAVFQDIYVHGCLYLSTTWLSFYANMFGWITFITVPWRDVVEITKEKTVAVFPDAVRVDTKSEKLIFSAFVKQSEAYRSLVRAWKNSLKEREQHLEGDSSAKDSHDDQNLFTTREEEPYFNGADLTASSLITTTTELRKNELQSSTLAESVGSSQDLDYDALCPCHDAHKGTQYINDVFNFNVDILYDHLFSQSSPVMTTLFSKLKFQQAIYTIHEILDDGSQTQTLSYDVPVGLAYAHTVTKQRMLKENTPGTFYVVRAESRTSGVPYGDAFLVRTHYCMTRVTGNRSRLRVTSEIVYTKKNLFGLVKKMITNGTDEGLKDYTSALYRILKSESDALMPRRGSLQRLTASSTESTNMLLSRKSQRKRNSLLDENTDPKQGAMSNSQSNVHSTTDDQPNNALSTRLIVTLLLLLLFFNLYLLHWMNSMEISLRATRNVEQIDEGSWLEWEKLSKKQKTIQHEELSQLMELVGTSVVVLDQMHVVMRGLCSVIEKNLQVTSYKVVNVRGENTQKQRVKTKDSLR